MTKPRRPLSEFVKVDTSSARADRMWSGLRDRLPAAAAPAPRWAGMRTLLLAAVVTLAFGAGFVLSRRASPSGWAQLQTLTGVTSVRLQEGSTLTLEPHTSLSVREQSGHDVRLALEEGRVQCDVTHDPERLFSVTAAEHEVWVRGTRFSVELSRERNELAVEVQSGRVEVRGPHATSAEVVLNAGQRWAKPLGNQDVQAPSSTPGVGAINSGAPLAMVETPDAGVTSSPAAAPAASSTVPVVTPRERLPQPRSLAEQGARVLLDRANTARRRGDLAAAAQAYEQLLREHAEDARVGLAAFELGRIRMDEFHDVHGAIQALQLAVRAAKEAGLREDALARLVRAHEILKDALKCRAARGEYLEAYPKGTHVLSVLQACEGL